jgi:hypothetical protein
MIAEESPWNVALSTSVLQQKGSVSQEKVVFADDASCL